MDTAMTAMLMTGFRQEAERIAPASVLYFEDMVPGLSLSSTSHHIERDELVKFAKIWDPLPFHVDEQAGINAFGSLTAPGLYVLAVKQRLIHQLPSQKIIASLGYDEVRFHVESPRVLRRLQTLRRWSHEQEIKQIFPGSA